MKVAIRVDASKTIGFGHWTRCTALARELNRNGAQVRFFSRLLPGFDDVLKTQAYDIELLPMVVGGQRDLDAKDRANISGVPINVDADQTKEAIGRWGAQWLVNDHYEIDADWQSKQRSVVKAILSIDDNSNRRHDCDFLLDQNLRDDGGGGYHDLLPPSATVICGPKFALLRPEFHAARENRRPHSGDVDRILIAFGGGGDENNITMNALQEVLSITATNVCVAVVVGGAYQHWKALQELSKIQENLEVFKNTSEMAGIMSHVDLALGAGGSMSWERCCLGIPSILATTAENHREANCALARKQVITHLGDVDTLLPNAWRDAVQTMISRPENLVQQSKAGMDLVDGLGAHRIAEYICNKS